MTEIVVWFPVMLVQPAVFILTTLPTYGSLNDSYSVCGQHPGIDAQYALSQWICSKLAKIIDNAVTITMNIYQHYNFTWKWINQAYDISDALPLCFDVTVYQNLKSVVATGCNMLVGGTC